MTPNAENTVAGGAGRDPADNTADTPQVAMELQEAVVLHQVGRLAEAGTIYRRVLQRHPQNFDALHLLGILEAQTRNHREAAELIGRAVAVNPLSAGAHFNLGSVLEGQAQFEAAVDSFDRAIALKADYADAYTRRGNVLRNLKRYEAAVDSYDRALMHSPVNPEALNNRGNVLTILGRFEAALASYDGVIALRPTYADAHFNRGIVLRALGRHTEALISFEAAIRHSPEQSAAHYHRGVTLQSMNRHVAALASFDDAIRRKADFADAFNDRGVSLGALKQFQAALDSYERAIALNPGGADAYNNRGNVLHELKQYAAAIESYDQALRIRPDYPFLAGMRLHTKLLINQWPDLAREIADLERRVDRREKATPPLPVLALTDSLIVQRKAAEIWVLDKDPSNPALGSIRKRPRRDKIRIGYFSADFHNHATMALVAELFERHDRSRFELIAFSFGPDIDDEMRRRAVAAFEKFIDVRDRSDVDIAALARTLEVDIAVDLKGLTQDCRAGIFAARAAPVQVQYIGYPGTMGADYIDYLIADPVLIPAASRAHYAEKIAYLPNSYQANDSQRALSAKVFTRTDLGLPPSGFVFCCFNNAFKITPSTFDSWMRILRDVAGSILWLLEENVLAVANLRSEAERRGVRGERLVFAGRLPRADHLARHRAADLFLDTLPYNAHTTASDALWAGVPVLTRPGESFAGRVAASLLCAVDLPEMIVATSQEYESLAIDLATHPERLKSVTQKLVRNGRAAPLFDAALFTRHIEAAYSQMHDRHHQGLAPDHIFVAP